MPIKIRMCKSIRLNEVNIGHGEGPTKWKGCSCK